MRLLNALLVLFLLGMLQPLYAQSPCDQITFSFTNPEPCRFRLQYVNSTECYNEIFLVLEQGEFVSYNVTAGYSVQQLGPSELRITHNQGFLPIGTQFPINFVLPYDLTTSIYVSYINYCPPGTGCALLFPPVLESCPDPQNASIIGTKYRECGNLPYTNQPTIPDWPIQLLDDMGNILAEQQTDGDGRYAIYDLPKGKYIVRELALPGWTPKVPASGEYVVDLGASQQVVRNFGNCQDCSCDQIDMVVTQEALFEDTATYVLDIYNAGADCFHSLTITVDTGALVDGLVLLPGWTLDQSGNQLVLTPPSPGSLSIGYYRPCYFRVSSFVTHHITVETQFGPPGAQTACRRPFPFPNPPVLPPSGCCPQGSSPGPELVDNGDFINNTAPGTDYTFVTGLGTLQPGQVAIRNPSQAYNSNNSWVQPGITGPTDNYLTVDGHSMAGKDAWRQVVTIQPGRQYTFCANANNLVRPSRNFDDPSIELYITSGPNNTVVATSGAITLTENPDAWVKIMVNWTSPSLLTPPYTLRIRSTSTSTSGNDFALDKISFRECLPLLSCVCDSNLVANPGFQIGAAPGNLGNPGASANWTAASLSPQVDMANGACDPVSILMWGNRDLGESICQPVSFVQGRTYAISFYAQYFVQNPNLTTPYVQFEFRAANNCTNPFTCGAGVCELIGLSAQITSPGWVQVTLPNWTPPTSSWNRLLIKATNNTPDVPGNPNTISWGRIDNICIRDVTPTCNADFSVSINCGNVTLTNQSTGTAPINPLWSNGSSSNTLNLQLPCGTYTYCLSITDATGCTSDICKTFTVSDNIPPVITCPPNVQLTCTGPTSPAATGFASATDNCSIPLVTFSNAVTGSAPCDQLILRTWTATDDCNNTATCVQTISVRDNILPIITCPQSLTVQGFIDPQGICKNNVTGIAPQASDNCTQPGPGVGYTINNGNLVGIPDASGINFNQGTTTVTYYALDACGNTASCSFTVTVECPDCQCPAPETPETELVVNGDFSATGGFNSDYINNCSGQLEGQQCITSNPQSVNPGYEPCTDAPSSTGGMLVVNGATISGQNVWCQSFNVTPNTNYIFSFYHTSLNNASPAQLQVYINGAAEGAIAQAPINACAWRLHCLVWNSGSNNGSIQICIQNLNTTAQGNDFALDLISFKKCSRCAPLPAGAVLWMPMDEQGGEASISGIVNGINGTPSNMVAFGGPNPVQGKVDAQGLGLGALAFTGPNPGSFASVSNDPSLNFGSGPFTIDAWVKTDLGTQTAPIVEKIVNQTGYALAITGTPAQGNLTLRVGTTPNIQVFQGPQVKLGQWNFVAAVINPPNVTLYVGEDPGGSSSFSSTTHTISGMPTNASNNNPLRIGYNPQNPHWDIAIDELEIFGSALTQTEVKRIWEADVEGKCRSLCQCGGFSKLYVRNKTGSINQSVTCGAQAVNLPCVTGQGYHLVGVFHCNGGECAPDHTINWTLTGPGGTTQNGSFSDNNPFFSIHLLPNWFSQAGNYKLTMSGDCGAQTCSCEVNLTVNCPNLCPCDAVNQQAFQQNVAKGFAAAISQKFCKACFTPLAVSDCETVTWYLGSVGGTYMGTTNGKNTLCYSFNQPGTYTVVMAVDRIKSDGTLCDYAEYSRTITLTCADPTACTGPTLPNARFSENPVAGRLDSVGSAPGWISGGSHEVYLLEDGTSQDGWSMGITGNFSESGILTSEAPYCVNKSDQGMLSVTLRTMGDPIPGVGVKVGRKPPGGANNIFLYTGTTIPVPNNPTGFCYPLAVMDDLLPFDDNNWYELEIPYNLSDWAALDSCGDQAGGIPARMALFVTNLLDENQASAGPVHDGVVIDHICFRGMTVSTDETAVQQHLRLFPNPTPGLFTLELPYPAPPRLRYRLLDLTGRAVQEGAVQTGGTREMIDAGSLPNGMYFLQVLSENRILATEKLLKQ